MVKETTLKAFRIDEEVITPEEYLNLKESERKEINKVVPFVKKLGEGSLDDSHFVGLKVQYKSPKYNFNF